MKKTKEELARKHYADIKQLIWSACVYPIRDYRGAIRFAGKLGDKGMTDTEKIKTLAEKVMGWNSPQAPGQWNPLKSIADAWMLVETLAHKGYEFYFESGPGAPPFAQFGQALSSAVTAETAPRAICEAALKTIGVEL